MKKTFYITTPIYYANDVPHIGHTGTTVFADVVARYKRLQGFDVFSLTGTDEHGEKVALSAEKAGKEPQTFVDELALKWQDYWKQLNISNDVFMRTTLPGHVKIAEELLEKLKAKGDVYEDTYKGVYCVGCEEFKSERDLVDGKCPEHRPDQVQYREEKNYFFRISKYIPEIKKRLEDGTLPLIPENKKTEMLAKLAEPVKDTSISRQNVKWGIPIPWDKEQTTYVWVEALMNYYSATRIDWNDGVNREEFWPADVHFLGKGNNWFHSVIWPSLLLALDLPLPKNIFVHGYYNVEGKKMGKSLGNVISPQDLMDKYGIDGTRYLLCASMPYVGDSDVSFKWFDEKYNSALANGYGNLVSRLSKLYRDVPEMVLEDSYFEFQSNDASERVFGGHDNGSNYNDAYNVYNLSEVTELFNRAVTNINSYLTTQEPWKKAGDEKIQILRFAIGQLLEVTHAISPVMPETAEKVFNLFKDKSASPLILFARI